MLHGVAAGLLHIHEVGLVHRDIALRNVLLRPDGHPLIADMGLARFLRKGFEFVVNDSPLPVRWSAPVRQPARALRASAFATKRSRQTGDFIAGPVLACL